MQIRLGITLLLCGVLVACTDSAPDSVPLDETAALEQVDTLKIQETNERFIGTLTDAGVRLNPLRLYVADRKMQRVAVITGDSSIDQFIGEAGKGPGELGRPVFLSVDGGRIIVAQQRWRGFSVFDTSGSYIDNHRLPDGHWVGGYDLFHTPDGYVLPITSFNPQRKGTLQVPSDEETMATLNEAFNIEEKFGAFPSLYREGEYFLQRRMMDVRGDSLAAVGYQLVPNVRLYDLTKPSDPHLQTLSFDHPDFRPPEEETPLDIAMDDQLYERLSNYVIVKETMLLREGVVMQVFANHTKGYHKQTEFEPSDQEYNATLGTIDSDERLHLSLPGPVLARDQKDRLYVELNATPDERKIGIYEVDWL